MSDKSSIQIKTGIGYYQNQRKEMLEFIPENAKFILEVGCGEGVFSSMMSREDREIWGIEINPQSAELARKKCKQVFVGDFNEIYGQLPRNYFDCIAKILSNELSTVTLEIFPTASIKVAILRNTICISIS